MNSLIKNGERKVLNKKTGKLKLVKNYQDDLLHGEYIYYWDNGNIRFCGEYKYSKRVGIWKNYNKYGEVILEEVCTRPTSSESINRILKFSYSLENQQLADNEFCDS